MNEIRKNKNNSNKINKSIQKSIEQSSIVSNNLSALINSKL